MTLIFRFFPGDTPNSSAPQGQGSFFCLRLCPFFIIAVNVFVDVSLSLCIAICAVGCNFFYMSSKLQLSSLRLSYRASSPRYIYSFLPVILLTFLQRMKQHYKRVKVGKRAYICSFSYLCYCE